MPDFTLEPGPQLLTPLDGYATLEVVNTHCRFDEPRIFSRAEYYPHTGSIESHFRITLSSGEWVWISCVSGKILKQGAGRREVAPHV